MTQDTLKTGLVLSGGGAKGAYHAGVVKALAELGTQVDMISGASIGALNGGVLACASSLHEGAQRLEQLWQTLADNNPLTVKNPYRQLAYLSLLAAAGLPARGSLLFAHAASGVLGLPPTSGQDAILCDQPLQTLMNLYLDSRALASGLPLYVSLFESQGGGMDLLRVMAAELGIADTPDSHFVQVQSLEPAQQRDALLASAALPLLYQSRQINGRNYTDGGQGGWRSSQGNTPATPLLEAGCKLLIVTHLSDGSQWSRQDYPDTTILEIRPQRSMSRSDGLLGGPRDLLGFDPERIPSWIEQGYRDTLHCVGRVMKTSQARSQLREASQVLVASEEQGRLSDQTLADAMQILD